MLALFFPSKTIFQAQKTPLRAVFDDEIPSISFQNSPGKEIEAQRNRFQVQNNRGSAVLIRDFLILPDGSFHYYLILHEIVTPGVLANFIPYPIIPLFSLNSHGKAKSWQKRKPHPLRLFGILSSLTQNFLSSYRTNQALCA